MRVKTPAASRNVLILLCLMYFITYVDRVNVSTAAVAFKQELGLTNTDLGLNYELPIARLRLFAQAKLINAFNNQAQINGNTTGILTSKSATCIQNVGPNAGARCQAFNPFTTTPVEGVNYRYTAAFGTPRTPTTG